MADSMPTKTMGCQTGGVSQTPVASEQEASDIEQRKHIKKDPLKIKG